MATELQDLNEKLDILVKLIACGLTTGRNQQERIVLFSRAGIKPKIIAELLGTTPNTVSVALNAMRKKHKNRK